MNSIDNLLTRLDSVLTAEHMEILGVVFLLISVVLVYLLGKWMNER